MSFKPTAGAAAAARRAIEWKEKYGDEVKGGTQVGWTRAGQLARRKNLSLETVKRMRNFFNRHEKNATVAPEHKDEPWKDNGYVAWLIWGGDAGRAWAEKVIEQQEQVAKSDSPYLADRLAARYRATVSDKDRTIKDDNLGGDVKLRNSAFCDTVKNALLPDVDDAWAWCNGRGEVAVHPVLVGQKFGRRGLLERSGTQAYMELVGDGPRNALEGYEHEIAAVKGADKDFTAEVYAVLDGDSFKIFLIDLLYWGDNLTRLGFKERRDKLVDFAQQNLIGSGRFALLEVRWILSHSELQDAVRWALAPQQVNRALLKSAVGEYPLKAPSSDWYELRKDRDSLSDPVAKRLDEPTLLAVAALGYRVKDVGLAKEEKDLPTSQVKARVLKADQEKQFVLGVVLEPMEVDGQEDIMIPEDIEDTAHDYLENHRVVGFRHTDEADAVVVESYIAPVDFEMSGETVKKGSWLLGVRIDDPDLWLSVQKGEINGFSVGGFGRREELE